jgi:tripartite-type tricarboxylate transporter receptor subunit TctC
LGARARLAAMLLVTLAVCTVGGATAADYPTRPVRLVVGFAAGGPTDILTRILAERLSQRTGQQFIVENRTGASSNVAVEAVLNAPRDGYTILVMSTANAINTTFRPSQSFSVLRDLAPVAGLARITYVVAVNPSVPARNIAEFVAYAKARPGRPSPKACRVTRPMPGTALRRRAARLPTSSRSSTARSMRA